MPNLRTRYMHLSQQRGESSGAERFGCFGQPPRLNAVFLTVQVCYAVQKLAKRMGRKPCEFYLWIDYACINQQVSK